MRDDDLLAAVERDYQSAGLDARRSAMLSYADKLTLRPATIERADVDLLRDAGFDDGDILAIAEVTGYYAYVNRIADGLGVHLEDDGCAADTDPRT